MSDPRDRPRPLLERFERFLDVVIPPPEDVAALVRRGEALLSAGDAEGALRLSDTALQQAPLYLRGLILHADAHAARQTPREALAALDRAARDRSLPPAVLARMALYAAQIGDEKRSLELEASARASVRGRDPDVARRLLTAAETLLHAGLRASAVRLARGATMVDPELGMAWVLLARDALDRGDTAQSRKAYDRGRASIDPADGRGNREVGEVAFALGDVETAVHHLRRAWIGGEESALPPLLAALTRAGDESALTRVLQDAEGSVARTARALLALSRAEPGAEQSLTDVHAEDLPEALWPVALDAALQGAPQIAERWAGEARERAGAQAVLALASARTRLAADDSLGARQALAPALDDARTAPIAIGLYRDACRQGWRARLGLLLEEIAAMAREVPAAAPFEAELRARRRELDEPLRVALLGEFSAGKSTFLNALVGAEVSPMGVLPTTAHVHWLRFGDPGARVVDSRGGAVLATIDRAPEIVDRKREAGEIVDYVEVTLPVRRLANLELIDTPGFNAGDAAHEAAVRRAFDIADVALWLFDARQAGKLSEAQPLEEARNARLPVLGVLNKADQVKPADRTKLLALLREGFRDLAPVVLAMSAREALAATLALEDPGLGEEAREQARAKLSQSGMVQLTGYLDEHLLAQRSAWKQLRVARRAGEIVDAAERSLEQQRVEHADRAQKVADLARLLGELRGRLATVSAALRKEVGAVLREQLRGLEGARGTGKGADAQALAVDAAAEIGDRARARALESLAGELRSLEQLAIEVGFVRTDAGAIVSAPVRLYLDHAASEGVRDATALPGAGPGFPAGDPLAALEQAVSRWEDPVQDRYDLLRVALRVAQEELASYSAPALPMID